MKNTDFGPWKKSKCTFFWKNELRHAGAFFTQNSGKFP